MVDVRMLALGALVTALGILEPQALPAEAAGWRVVGPPARYDAETIFQYIDGHGEVYRAYGMIGCLAQRYAGPPGEGDIVADVFEMASAADAFGVFSHTREGEPADVGQGASFGYGTLAFWKGRHFASISTEQDGPRAREAVLALGRVLAAALEGDGEPPALVGRLPAEGLDAGSIVYLRHPQILNAHLALGTDNLLGLGPSTAAVVGRYRRAGASAAMAIVEYGTAPLADAAQRIFAARFLEQGVSTRRGDGWYAVATLPGPGSARAFVVRASTRELAEALLAEAARKDGPR
jgi:hypothetical protein